MMATNPDILLMDEPLSALDTYLRWQMEEELLELFARIDRTVLFVTHSRDEVYHLCNRVCIVQEGKSQPAQEKDTFFANPGTLAAARISGCRNFSAVKHLSEYELLAEEWGMRLSFSKPVPADITHVGIRAHYIKAVPSAESAEAHRSDALPSNTAVFEFVRIYEQQFESELILRGETAPTGERRMLRLLLRKEQAEQLSDYAYIQVSFRESDILLLKE
jgi:molybdate transport system ATP-binding protein